MYSNMAECVGQAVTVDDLPFVDETGLSGDERIFGDNPDGVADPTYKTAFTTDIASLANYLRQVAATNGVLLEQDGVAVGTQPVGTLNFIGDFTISNDESGHATITNPKITFNANLSISPNIVDYGNTPETVNLSWSYTETPLTQQINGSPIADINQRTATLALPVNKTFLLEATSNFGSDTATVQLIERSRNYYAHGDAAMTALADVSIDGSSLDADRFFTAPFSANTSGLAGYLYIIYAASKGAATLRAENGDDITTDFESPQTLSLDNGYGDVRDYLAYRSKFPTQGAFTVVVE